MEPEDSTPKASMPAWRAVTAIVGVAVGVASVAFVTGGLAVAARNHFHSQRAFHGAPWRGSWIRENPPDALSGWQRADFGV